MMELNRNLAQVSPSLTLVLAAKVNELKSKGVDVVGFTVGEPDFPTPEYIKKAGHAAIDSNFTRYTAGIGITELRQAVVDKLKQDHGLEYQVDNIAVSNGAKHSISNVVYTVTNPGDEVIIPVPYWLSYPEIVKLCGGKCVFVDTKREEGYKLTPEVLKAAITDKTKLLFLNSPNNPTGAVYSLEELRALVPVIKESGIWVISDEIYEKLVYGDTRFESLAQFDEIKDQVILVNGVSKAYSMTGWRIGYFAAVPEIVNGVKKVQSHFTSSCCSISQKAALAALQGGKEEVEEMRKSFGARRDLAFRLLQEIPGIKIAPSQGAFYLFPDCSYYYGKSYRGKSLDTSLDLANYFLDECHVAVVPGAAFGSEQNFRISYATSESEIEKGINRIKQGLEKLS